MQMTHKQYRYAEANMPSSITPGDITKQKETHIISINPREVKSRPEAWTRNIYYSFLLDEKLPIFYSQQWPLK